MILSGFKTTSLINIRVERKGFYKCDTVKKMIEKVVSNSKGIEENRVEKHSKGHCKCI